MIILRNPLEVLSRLNKETLFYHTIVRICFPEKKLKNRPLSGKSNIYVSVNFFLLVPVPQLFSILDKIKRKTQMAQMVKFSSGGKMFHNFLVQTDHEKKPLTISVNISSLVPGSSQVKRLFARLERKVTKILSIEFGFLRRKLFVGLLCKKSMKPWSEYLYITEIFQYGT